MPFKNVPELKASELFARMKTLHAFSEARLRVFVATFGRVFERAVRGGASEDEAESRALPISLTAARNAAFVPEGRKAEEASVYFAAMAEDMVHGDGESVNLSFPPIEDLDAGFSGQPFFAGEHRAHDGLAAEPVGVIRGFKTRVDLPADVAAKVDPDVRVVIVASYFDDVPADERLDTISPEWDEMRTASGTLAIPHNFIITKVPMNDKVLGIGRVAGNPYKASIAKAEGSDSPMTGENADASAAAVDNLKSQVASLEREQKGFQARLASLVGAKDYAEVEPKIAALLEQAEKAKGLEARVAAMEAAAKTEKAITWATEQSKGRKFATEAIPKWASLYERDPAQAQELVTSLPDAAIAAVTPPKAGGVLAETPDEHISFLKGAF